MTHHDFFAAVAENIWLYIGVLSSILLSVVYIIRKRIVGVFDPLFLVAITAAFDAAATVVLVKVEAIGMETAIICFLSAGSFFIALVWSQRQINRTKLAFDIFQMFQPPPLVLILTTGMWVGLLLVKYTLWGVPLFEEGSRVANFFSDGRRAYAGINTVAATLGIVLLVVSLSRSDRILLRKVHWRWALLTIFFIDGVLSGSKLGVILGLGGIWQLSRYTPGIRASLFGGVPVKRLLILGALVFSLVSVARYNSSTLGSVFSLFIARLVQTSDAYFLAADGQGFMVPVQGLTGLLSIAIPSLYGAIFGAGQVTSYGQMIFEATMGFPNTEAPNARTIVVLVATLGTAAVPMSLLIGLVAGGFRLLTRGLSRVYAAPIFLWAPNLYIDLPYAIGRLKWILLSLFVLAFLSVIFRTKRIRHTGIPNFGSRIATTSKGE